MRTLLLTLAAVGALAVAGTASAGGWATAGVSPPPDDPTAGSTWEAKITVLQHGQTPLVGISPTISLIGKGGKRETFSTKPTDEPGVYLAKVKFPAAGSWSYEVDDGFTSVHTFAPVTVGEPLSGGGRTWAPFALGLALALALAGAAFALVRRRPAPAASASAG